MPVALVLLALSGAAFAQPALSPIRECSRLRATETTPTSPAFAKAATEFRKSQNALENHEIDKAIRHLHKGIQLDPCNANAYNDLGTIYFNTNVPAKALEAFSRMVEIDPQSFRGHLNIAFVHFSAEHFSEAEQAARLALRLEASDARARYLLGASLVAQKKNPDEARVHLGFAAPEMVEARYQLAQLLINMGDLERGMKEMQRYSIESRRSR